MVSEGKTWVKVGITIVGKPGVRGSGLAIQLPKKTCDAYDLWTAEAAEITIERVLKTVKAEEVAA